MNDPSTEEIAAELLNGGTPSPSQIERVRVRLTHIRLRLARVYDTIACPLNGVYYDVFRTSGVQNDGEAEECIPGRGRRAVGIYTPVATDDLIIRAWIRKNINSGAGKTRVNLDRALIMWEQGQLTPERVRDALGQAQEQSTPTKQEALNALTSSARNRRRGSDKRD